MVLLDRPCAEVLVNLSLKWVKMLSMIKIFVRGSAAWPIAFYTSCQLSWYDMDQSHLPLSVLQVSQTYPLA